MNYFNLDKNNRRSIRLVGYDIYPKVDDTDLVNYSLENIGESLIGNEITPYYKVYKLGVALPMIE